MSAPQPPLQSIPCSVTAAAAVLSPTQVLSALAAPSSSYPFHAAAGPHIASDPPPSSAPTPPSEAQQVSSASPVPSPTAVPSLAQSLSALAAPFSPSDPVQSVQHTSTINKHPSTSSLRVQSNFEKYNIRCEMPPESHPYRGFWERLDRSIGEQNGGVYALMNAPSPSNFSRQNLLEGVESEGSFETDSQQNSPSGSPLKDTNRCIFPPQSCVSEGEELTEDHTGFQGHNSDVDFYHRPRSSKKNKRQPDGPLRVQLRARKGPSSRK